MNITQIWTPLISLALVLFSHGVFATNENVDKQMSAEMKGKMRSICASPTGKTDDWQVADVTTDAERSLNVVLYQMNAEEQLKAINEVRTQMAEGVRYAFEFELQNGEVWNAMVLHSNRGDYMIERHAKMGPLCPKEK